MLQKRKNRACTEDVWPSSREEHNQLIIRLQHKELEALRWREPDPVRREQVVDAAVDRLMARRETSPPEHPACWFHAVAIHEMVSTRTPQRTMVQLTWEPEAASSATEVRETSTWLRVHLDELKNYLTWREFRILTACLTYGRLAAVSHVLDEHPSNLERAIRRIGHKVSGHFFPNCTTNPPL